MNEELRALGFLLVVRSELCDQGSTSNAHGPEHALVTLNLRRWTERLRVVIGEFDRRPPFDRRNFGDQADGIKVAAATGIASPEIIGEQCPPAGTESNLTILNPLALIEEIGRIKEVCLSCARLEGATEICMQAEDFINIQSVGCDDEFVSGIAATRF